MYHVDAEITLNLFPSAGSSRQLVPDWLQQRARTLLLITSTRQVHSSITPVGPVCSQSSESCYTRSWSASSSETLQPSLSTSSWCTQETSFCFWGGWFLILIGFWFPATLSAEQIFKPWCSWTVFPLTRHLLTNTMSDPHSSLVLSTLPLRHLQDCLINNRKPLVPWQQC